MRLNQTDILAIGLVVLSVLVFGCSNIDLDDVGNVNINISTPYITKIDYAFSVVLNESPDDIKNRYHEPIISDAAGLDAQWTKEERIVIDYCGDNQVEVSRTNYSSEYGLDCSIIKQMIDAYPIKVSDGYRTLRVFYGITTRIKYNYTDERCVRATNIMGNGFYEMVNTMTTTDDLTSYYESYCVVKK